MLKRWTVVQMSFVEYGRSKWLLNIPIHAQDRLWQRHASWCGRGTQTEVVLRQRLGEHVCVLWWTDLTTCDVSANLGAVIFQIRTRKVNHLQENGPEVRVRCGG